MALGPKAMGDAIAANLKAKTGKTLEEWLQAVDEQKITAGKDVLAWLKSQGLGHFQARLVLERREGQLPYDNPQRLIDDLFADYPEQRQLFVSITDTFRASCRFDLNPCKGYTPLYNLDGRIFASFKPTRQGLYLGLIGNDFDFETIAHKPSRGGSDAMQRGVLVNTPELGLQALKASYQNSSLTTLSIGS